MKKKRKEELESSLSEENINEESLEAGVDVPAISESVIAKEDDGGLIGKSIGGKAIVAASVERNEEGFVIKAKLTDIDAVCFTLFASEIDKHIS